MINTRTIQSGVRVLVFVLGVVLFIAAVTVLSQMGSRSPGQLFHARVFAQAHLLSNGKLLLLGGWRDKAADLHLFRDLTDQMDKFLNPGVFRIRFKGPFWEDVQQFELFDPSTKSWSLMGREKVVRRSFSIGRDRILIINDNNTLNIYNTNSGMAESCDPSPLDLSVCNATKLNNGKILIVSRDHSDLTIPCSIEFDPISRKFDLDSSRKLEQMRYVEKLQCLEDGDVLMFHVKCGPIIDCPKCDKYDSKAQKWSYLCQLSEQSYELSLLLPNGLVLIIYQNTGDCELLNPITGFITKCSSTRPSKKKGSLFPIEYVVLLKNGRVLLISEPCQIYDPISDKWSATGAIHQLKVGASVRLLENGKVLVAGGSVNNHALATCELYDPVTGEWTEL